MKGTELDIGGKKELLNQIFVFIPAISKNIYLEYTILIYYALLL